MLTTFHKTLLGLLVAQIALAVVLFATGGAPAPVQAHALLPGFDAAKVTRLQVESDSKIDLVKKGDTWVVASSFDYPADKTKVDGVLAPIAKLAAAEPVAESKSRHKQLGVADDGFKRKLTITADGKDTVLYIGSEAGLRRNAVRLAGSDDVYGVSGISEYSVPATVNLWVDPHYYSIPKDQIAKITAGAFVFTHADDGTWTATADGAPIEPLDTDKVDQLVNQIASVDLLEPAPLDPGAITTKQVLDLRIELKPSASGASVAPVEVEVIGTTDGKHLWVHHKAMNRAVLIDPSRMDVMSLDKAQLIKAAAPPVQK